MSFEKDTIYYRADAKFEHGIETSGFLGCHGGTDDVAIDMKKIALEIRNFINDESGKTLEIVKHVAKAGDDYAHVDGIVLRLERIDGKIIAE